MIDELVLTMLSQHTSDTNRDRAFEGLTRRFPTWEQVREAPVSDIEEAIRPGGIARVKARRIKALLEEIHDREGKLDLSGLAEMSDEEATRYLTSLHGVGPKSAACVLLFSMGRAAFPIDTHVHRVSRRLGLIPPKMSADRAHAVLSPTVPPDIRYDLHVALIDHGRTICKAQRPLCADCVLLDICAAGPLFLSKGMSG